MTNVLICIVAVVLSSVAIIAVMFWRLKPQPAADLESLKKRLAEEAQKLQALQAALEDKQQRLTSASSGEAAAKASLEATLLRAVAAEQQLGQVRSDGSQLQLRLDALAPQIERAQAHKQAADARCEGLLLQVKDWTEQCKTLRMDGGESKRQLSVTEAQLAVVAERAKAAENAKMILTKDIADLATKHEDLLLEHRTAVERAATAQAEAKNLHLQTGDMGRAIEALQDELTQKRAEVVAAAAKQQAGEDAERHFENISHKVLKETLAEAKRGMGDLAESLQKAGGDELQKHAEKVARTLEPLQNKLKEYDEAVESLKKNSQETYGGLRDQLVELQKTERTLHDQAKALTTALSASPKVRGGYGEFILKQLVEFVGMHEHCHFETQASRDTEEGRKIPDMVITLPAGQKVLVDSKAVMEACVEAYKAEDDIQRAFHLKQHCKHIRDRIVDLSSKNYFADHKDAVEAVVLFLPAENLYAAAMENDPGLTEFAIARNIIVCGPNSLLMLLKVATQIWRRAAIEQEAQQITKRGNDVYKAACEFISRFGKIGVKIRQLGSDYNEALGTLDGRLIPAGRDLARMHALSISREIEDPLYVKEDVHDFRSVEAKAQLNLDESRRDLLQATLPEDAEVVLASGDPR